MIAAAVFAVANPAGAQEALRLVDVVEDDLPSPVILALAQDRAGFLWIGTSAGLARYDGSGVTNFAEASEVDALPTGPVRALLVTRDDVVVAAVEGFGLVRLGADRTRFETVAFDSSPLFPDVEQIREDSRGRIWVGGSSGRVAVLDGNEVVRDFTLPGTPRSSAPRVASFLETPDGRVWIGTFEGDLLSVDPGDGSVSIHPVPGLEEGRPSIRDMWLDEAGRLWLATTGVGIAVYDPDEGVVGRFAAGGPSGSSIAHNDAMNFERVPGLGVLVATYGGGVDAIDLESGRVVPVTGDIEEPRTSTVLRTRDGVIWVGTWGAGVHAFAAPVPGVHPIFADGFSGLAGADVTSVSRASDGGFWVTTYDDGLHHLSLDPIRLTLERDQPLASLDASPRLYQVLEARDGRIWVATWGLGLHLREPGGSFRPVRSEWQDQTTFTTLHEDEAGRIWVGSREGIGVVEPGSDVLRAVALPLVDDDLPPPWVREVSAGPDGRLLLSTTYGLALLDPETRRGRWLLGGRPASGSATSLHVTTATPDPGGETIWVGEESGGLFRISIVDEARRMDGPLLAVPVADPRVGEPGIEALVFDDAGRLWISTNHGLAFLRAETDEYREFYEVDGLASDVGARGGLVWDGRTLVVAGTNGLTVVRPEELGPPPPTPTVAITAIHRVVDNELTVDPLPGEALGIPWGRSTVLVEYASVELNSPAPATYEYRLRADQDWRPLGTSRTIAVGDNAPGRYDVQVRALTARGLVTEPSSPIAIEVVPPWWMTLWARTLFVVGALGLVVGIASARLQRLERHNARLQGEIDGRVAAEAERDRMTEQFRRAQRLEAVGELTGGVAHDFNNILTVIRGNLDLISMYAADDPETAELAGECIHAAEQAGRLTQQLLSFSRKQVLSPRSVDVATLAQDMRPLLRSAVGDRYRLGLEVSEDVGVLRVDSAHLQSAILNLLLNARDAQPDGGPLEVRCDRVRLPFRDAFALDPEGAASAFTRSDDEVGARIALDEEMDFVRFAVSDRGTGMPDTVRAQAFEPFFTTKAPGEGTGLGLSMVYGFVRQSRGLITIRTEPGTGTTVTLHFPAVEGEEAGFVRSTPV